MRWLRPYVLVVIFVSGMLTGGLIDSAPPVCPGTTNIIAMVSPSCLKHVIQTTGERFADIKSKLDTLKQDATTKEFDKAHIEKLTQISQALSDFPQDDHFWTEINRKHLEILKTDWDYTSVRVTLPGDKTKIGEESISRKVNEGIHIRLQEHEPKMVKFVEKLLENVSEHLNKLCHHG